MKLTLRQLIAFAAIADTGSTSAAGGLISLSQSATSAALNELEANLEMRLFDRVGSRLVLNDLGRAVLSRARAVIDGAADIEREFGGGGAVTPLRVGASTTIGNYLLPTLIATYLTQVPEAQFDVRVENTANIVSAVSRLELDLAFVEGPCREPEVVSQVWRDDELFVVAAPSHPALPGDANAKLGIGVLRGLSWLLREPGSGTREAVEQALLPHLKELREGLRFGGTEAIKLATANGLGFACLPAATVDDWIQHGRLIRVKTTLPRLWRPLWLVQHRSKKLSASAANFIQHCCSS